MCVLFVFTCNKLDMPMEATLNLSMVDDTMALNRLIHMHGLEIIDQDSHRGQVRVKGSMMMLRSFKAETQKLLEAQTSKKPPSYSSRPPSPLSRPPSYSSLGHSPSPPAADSRNSTRGSSAQAQQNHQRSAGARSFDSLSPTPSSSSRSVFPSFSSLANGPVDVSHPPPRNLPTESFVLSSEVLDYAQRLKKLGMDDILENHGVQMDVVARDTDFCEVNVTGRGARDATAVLQRFLSDLQATLHTRQILISDLDHEAQVGVAKRIQELTRSYASVLISQRGGVVHLIGPRASCEELKERLMQQRPAELPQAAESGRRTGRSQEKERSAATKRRSRSAPKYTAPRRSEELAGEATATPPPMSSLNFWPRGRDEGGQDAALTPEVRGQRGRSNSVTRTSVKPEKRDNSVSPDRTNSKPATAPAIKGSLMGNFNMKAVKKRFQF